MQAQDRTRDDLIAPGRYMGTSPLRLGLTVTASHLVLGRHCWHPVTHWGKAALNGDMLVRGRHSRP